MVDRPNLLRYERPLLAICEQASQQILSVYNSMETLTVKQKADASPVTEADIHANDVILSGLAAIDERIPILSEEASLPPYEARRDWPRYWLVDPLDGTKEFIQRTGEFTVNIALIEAGRPVLGIVYVPVDQVAYIGARGEGAYKLTGNQRKAIQCNSAVHKLKNGHGLDVMVSAHHNNPETLSVIECLKKQGIGVRLVRKGSSLKFCLIAEGLADFYPRLSPTSEWDTAAAHAVLLAAGGNIVNKTFDALTYNARPSILNPSFFAFGDENVPWRTLLEP